MLCEDCADEKRHEADRESWASECGAYDRVLALSDELDRGDG
jgi:hypothetical protein